jgi:hypothetical protein
MATAGKPLNANPASARATRKSGQSGATAAAMVKTAEAIMEPHIIDLRPEISERPPPIIKPTPRPAVGIDSARLLAVGLKRNTRAKPGSRGWTQYSSANVLNAAAKRATLADQNSRVPASIYLELRLVAPIGFNFSLGTNVDCIGNCPGKFQRLHFLKTFSGGCGVQAGSCESGSYPNCLSCCLIDSD